MFLGLTNQVSSWMSFVRNKQEDKNPSSMEEPTATLDLEKTDSSITKNSELDMLAGKRQIHGTEKWLGHNFPKFIKDEDPYILDGNQPLNEGENTSVSTESIMDSPRQNDDDSLSATTVVSLGTESTAGEPTEETKIQFSNVQSKVVDGAKLFGNFLYSAVNEAGKTVSETCATIKKTVEESSIFVEFNKEQEAFLKSEGCINVSSSLPPWAGCLNQGDLKQECLAISTDIRNFVRSPPPGIEFNFDYEVSYPIAMAIMEEDPNLEKNRYELVPKVISEENFWRNYFYRVTLVCQRNNLTYIANVADSALVTNTSLSDYSMSSQLTETSSHEFVPDTLQICSQDKVPKAINNEEEEWEKDLEAELQNNEIVDMQNTGSENENWKQELDALLMDEDLK